MTVNSVIRWMPNFSQMEIYPLEGLLLGCLSLLMNFVINFQEFDVDALVKFVEETSIPTVTLFDKGPKHHPFVIKYFNSPNAKAMLFLNFSNGQFDAFESKYRNVALHYKGEGLSFLMGDLEASQGAFQYFGIKED